MALRFTDSHAMSLVSPELFPGEQVLFRARGVEKPWYARLFSRLGWFSWRYWLIVATSQRQRFSRKVTIPRTWLRGKPRRRGGDRVHMVAHTHGDNGSRSRPPARQTLLARCP